MTANRKTFDFRGILCAVALALCGPVFGSAAHARQAPTFEDLASLSDAADHVLQVRIIKQATVEPDRSPGLAPGFVRIYAVGTVKQVLHGGESLTQVVRYLADVPLDARGAPPRVKGGQFIIFARAVPGSPGEVVLVAPDAQLPVSEELKARLVPLLAEIYGPGAPPRLTRISNVLSVAGNLAGESETQIFIDTRDSGPVLVSVVRRPGRPPAWGFSWSELVDQANEPPLPGSIAWYRLACTLPQGIPPAAHRSANPEDRRRATLDYAFVIESLGPCHRTQPGAR